ncbi:10940_t:CDS:10 [Racocetra fulgida]|uniref:10940_t:CDS:1 n=1 Tax=Racocetra fulgida TaxID=60492 RepID=A0A9N8WIK5_9GLOM|nr:10940_t:CDS:10 [Racocetra fulgida]
MPRCISNVISSYNDQLYNATFFGHYVTFDLVSSKNTNPTFPIFLPADDPLYNPNPNTTISPYQLSVPFLPVNRSDGNSDTNPNRNPLLSGINNVTPFFDLNNIYGISDQDAMNRLRDTSTNRGKLKTSIVNGEQFPPKNSAGSYIWGSTSERSYSIFTLAIQTIWIREHNRLCDELYQLYGSSWTDEQYFQEARRWTIAFYQKAVAEEYIGAILGSPLPAYQSYNPDLKPDEYGDTLYNLPLNNIKNLTLLESLGLERVLWSMILQRQEEVDIFFADSTKNINAPDRHTYDLIAFDIIRSRDHGVDTVEALVGVMSEDHLDGANFGKTMNASMVMQKPDMFTAEEQKIIRNTTLRNIIIRNINQNVTFPQNIWAVQPQIKLNSSDDNNYPSKIGVWTQYIISYRVDLTYIYFKVQLQTSDGNGWFGMGFGPDDDGMKGAEFIIGIVGPLEYTICIFYHPPLRDSNQDPTLEPKFSMSDSKAVTVEFKRLLNPPGKKPIVHSDMKYETMTEKKTMMHAHINHQDYVKLPEFTWEEINERVQRGDEEIVEDIDCPKALLIPKDTPSENQSSVLAKYVTHLQGKSAPQKRLSAAQFIDNINTKFYLRKPLAEHNHSRFATQKMATLVIGKMSEKISEKGLLAPSNESIYQNPVNDSVEIDKASTPKFIKFHRYKLTSKKMVNANVKYPVIRFTFSIVHQGEKDVSTEKFLPGHYIEVQSRVNSQILIRSYTPLEGSLSKSFSIYVKIYPKGLFSQHLVCAS